MLRSASEMIGYAITASDGNPGTVSDFLFDDQTWRIRWLVADTGNWLPGRKLLLPPTALGHPDPKKLAFPVRLTMRQVEESPDILSDRPVSRQDETNTYDYYGWRPYWDNGFFMGGYGSVAVDRDRDIERSRLNDGDPHLRSVEALTGCHIHAADGDIGHIEDFLVDDVDWTIHFLVVTTTNWWPGKTVLIPPVSVAAIDWPERMVNLTVDRQRVKDSPIYDPAAIATWAYTKQFKNHYGDT